ncbi:MAG: NOL1/NOP2/sun family putative RNA methylase [Nanoarchaeota archaeon]|nr:NOL1/NOP2/sun family putative RNA methylase [Nanoarchaeota archaeon]MBU1321809.1 NOL1/NOP2/sun family putative RNA methylase [Nanoarchaeota archaeon]MBU1598256.1 NOL1/NOP2/sun family putative RNA methylase [Nanoarchaeota archaeon]MBU2441715.1 NOL1/NOP2/sun family putative RNA methylase [Nanoarchaeota archaeon]
MTELEAKPGSEKFEVKEKFEIRYREILAERYDEFIEISKSYIRKGIRVNTLKISVADLIKRLEKKWNLVPVPWCKEGFWVDHKGKDDKKRYDIGNLLEHQQGYIYVQEPASMIPPIVLETKPGEVVLDMCAAPGSKSSQMAAMMKNKGILISNDSQMDRLTALSINMQRVGASNVLITHMSGHRFKKLELRFDKVLVDAPCSGTGTIRRSLKTLDTWGPNLVRKMAADQKQLAASGFEVLKPGGTMIYSTCTMEPEENEGVVNWLLEKYPDAKVEKIELNIKRSPAILEFGKEKYNPQVKECLRIWPQDNDSEGFFVAKIRKTE